MFNVFFSPLSSVPGPWPAKVTSAWLTFIDLAGDRTQTIHQLHQRYGSTVRIGVKEVSFSDTDSIKQIYGQQTAFFKAPIYESMSLPPPALFSMRDKSAHSQRRRLLSHVFSQSNLGDAEPLIASHIQQLMSGHILQNLGKPLDILRLFRLTAFDIVGKCASFNQQLHILTVGSQVSCSLANLSIAWSPPRILQNSFVTWTPCS